ncbi:ferredoxin [Streptomyces sp. NPDC050287]|uniref:ferredoxin n=1 Tax=Streptomyces sp. NPDC050287 TaxID=3365608 RepID=UPI0037A835C3
MKVTADQEACCGSGMCVVRAEGVFDQREEDGVVVVLDSAPPPEHVEAVREAAAVCPTGAIHLTE